MILIRPWETYYRLESWFLLAFAILSIVNMHKMSSKYGNDLNLFGFQKWALNTGRSSLLDWYLLLFLYNASLFIVVLLMQVVAGGGAVESALSVYLEYLATTLGSREQLALAEFAEALLIIPKV